MTIDRIPLSPLLLLVLLLLLLARRSSAQDGPPSLVKILQNAGRFSNFLRLLKITHMVGQIDTQVSTSGDGLTILAPTDAAFSTLKPGALSSVPPKDQVQLIQFHVITQFLSKPLFLTVSNSLRTDDGQFPLHMTAQANQLALYEVDQVLLPPTVFPPSAAPTLEKAQNETADVAPAIVDVNWASRTMGGGTQAIVHVAILYIEAIIACSIS